MAVVHCGPGYTDSYFVWTMDFTMSIEGAIVGLVMLLQPTDDGNVAKKVYNGVIYTGKIIAKTEEGTWGASMHEEKHTIIKKTIKKMEQEILWK